MKKKTNSRFLSVINLIMPLVITSAFSCQLNSDKKAEGKKNIATIKRDIPDALKSKSYLQIKSDCNRSEVLILAK